MKLDNILIAPNDKLRCKSKPLKILTKGKQKRILGLFDLMYSEVGIGLAAPQVGWSTSVFVVGLESNGKKVEYVFINPKILEYSKEVETMSEGCLSMPDVSADVVRPNSIVVDAFDINNKKFVLETSGVLARCIQHEYDHLFGILCTDRTINKNWVKAEEFKLKEDV